MTDYNYLDKGNDDGTILGTLSTSKVGFWGVTPVVQGSALSAAATAITFISASASLSTTICMTVGASSWGFSNTSEAQTFLKSIQNLQLRQKEVETVMVNAGLIAGGTEAADSVQTDTVDVGGGEGSVLGQTTAAKISFWGNTPVNQPEAFTATVTTTTQPNIIVSITASQIAAGSGNIGIMIKESATAWGFKTFNAGATFLELVSVLETRLALVNTRLVELGMIAGGTAKTTATDYDYLDKGQDSGTRFGRDTSALVGFWETTPVNQPAALTTAALTIIASISTTTTDNAIAALISTTDSYHVDGITAKHTMLDAVDRLQTRQTEIESRLEEVGLLADDSIA